MPLIAHVGLSRKVGEPNYGSRGASVQLEVELDSGVIDAPDRLRERIRQLFQLTRAAVEEELQSAPRRGVGKGTGQVNGAKPPGAAARRSQGAGGDPDRPATALQVRALHAAAAREEVNLSGLLQQRFGVELPDQLTISDASDLLDEIRRRRTARTFPCQADTPEANLNANAAPNADDG
jgi:hypothetical protein